MESGVYIFNCGKERMIFNRDAEMPEMHASWMVPKIFLIFRICSGICSCTGDAHTVTRLLEYV